MQREELERTHVALEISRDRYVDLYTSAPVGYLSLSADGRIQDANLTVSALLGVERGRLRGRGFGNFVAPESLPRWGRLLSTVRADAERHSCDLLLRRDDGATIDARLICQFSDSTDAEGAVRVVLTDVTEQKHAEAKVRTYVDLAPAALLVLDGQGRFVDGNPAALALLGVDATTLRSMTIVDAVAPPGREEALRGLETLRATGALEKDHQLLRPDGRRPWVAVRAVRIANDRYMAFCMDVTRQRQTLDALQASEQRFRDVAASTDVYIFEMDARGVITFISEAVEVVLGYRPDEMVGRSSLAMLGPAEQARSAAYLGERVARREKISHFQQEAVHRNGRPVWLDVSAVPMISPEGTLLGYRGAALDVTESRTLQAQLAVSSRLAAMGTLVAGVAHEINNPLAGNMACQALAVQEARKLAAALRGGDPLDREAMARGVEEIIEMLGRAEADGIAISRIVKDLSAFGRPDAKRSPIQLSTVVASAMRWLRASIRDAATIRIAQEATPDVLASAGQMEQVIVNLATNASLAIPAGRPGEISIRVGPGAPGMVRLEVSDDGCGMAPDILQHAFDPFFTTRATGKGTGLGLAICHSIVTAHGGTLSVKSEAGKGSTFRVELPVAPSGA